MMNINARTGIGIFLVIAGGGMLIVSIWLIADAPRHPIFPSQRIESGDAPKVGIPAGILALMSGIGCFVLKEIERRKRIVILVIFVVLVLTLASFGLAVKRRMDFKKAEDEIKAQKENPILQNFNRGFPELPKANDLLLEIINSKEYGYCKTQVTVMAVVAGIATLLEFISMIMAATIRRSPMSNNAMQMERSF